MGEEEVGVGSGGDASVDVPTPVDPHRLIHERHRAGGRNRLAQRNLRSGLGAEGDPFPVVEVEADDDGGLVGPGFAETAQRSGHPLLDPGGLVERRTAEDEIQIRSSDARQKTAADPPQHTRGCCPLVEAAAEPLGRLVHRS